MGRSLTRVVQAVGALSKIAIHRRYHLGGSLRCARPVVKKLGKALLVLLSALGGVSALLLIITSMSPKPDLHVGNVTWFPQNPWPGQRTTFSLQVENRGASDASSFLAELRADSTVMSAFVPGIAKGSSQEVRMIWQPKQVGNATVWVVLDTDGVIAETDEENNKYVVTIEVEQPPILLNPSGIRHSLVRGQDISFEFVVDWRGNPKQQIGFEIRQYPRIENGGISVGSPILSPDGTSSRVTGMLLTGEDTLPGFYLIEILAEGQEGDLLGIFQIELFVDIELENPGDAHHNSSTSNVK